MRTSRNRFGFTLVEMLAVCAIIVIMMALVAPVVGTMTSTAGRKGAVNILMNTLEQARVAALESGRDVHVLLWRRQFPERDAIMVVRERDLTTSGTGYEQLTRWIKLPQGVLLHNNATQNILKAGLPQNFDLASIQGNPNAQEVSAITFNPYGGVKYPAQDLLLFVADGVRGNDRQEAVFRKDSGIFEIISLRRFTGRASLEVSAI